MTSAFLGANHPFDARTPIIAFVFASRFIEPQDKLLLVLCRFLQIKIETMRTIAVFIAPSFFTGGWLDEIGKSYINNNGRLAGE
ncbi:hypothetical protein ATO13_23596 [Stappia sp. 22II-S9-Z10]|nr:hypothetical protein ATO13_23596 [Stappia sp. 22II-S9-Z10]